LMYTVLSAPGATTRTVVTVVSHRIVAKLPGAV
jgi:hypothetical protein